MARRRLTPAQPGYLAPVTAPSSTGLAPPIAKVSGQSAEAAALRELSDGLEKARQDGRMVVEVPLADVAAGHLVRDRIALDLEELTALKESIRAHGQRVPADITPLPGLGAAEDGASPYRFGLISGWRRLRALSELYDETGEARFSTLRALIRPQGKAAEAYVAMVEENEIRAGLSYYERARLVVESVRAEVFPDVSTALKTLFANASRAKRSKIASFIDIHDQLGDLLIFPSRIPERLGLALVARLREVGSHGMRTELTRVHPDSAEAELVALERLARPAKPAVSRAKQEGELLCPGVTLKVSGGGAHGLSATLSGPGVDEALLARIGKLLRSGA